jgi:hypothetical protein
MATAAIEALIANGRIVLSNVWLTAPPPRSTEGVRQDAVCRWEGGESVGNSFT